MNATGSPPQSDPLPVPERNLPGALVAPLTTGLTIWVLISLGFFGLKTLMQERPEFVGQPVRVTRAELVQDSPQVVARKVSDDVSVVKSVQPEFSDVRFDMQGRRDYRGLRTIMDMSGEFRARYVLTNAYEEPAFALFKCPHPRARNSDSQNLLAGELKLQASTPGEVENATNAWFWSGTLAPHATANIEISYHVAALKGVTYRVSEMSGNQAKHLRVTLKQKDVSAMRLESSDGATQTSEETFVWERNNFLAPDFFSAQIGENRSLYTSLAHLLEIGPLICLLFLLAVSATIAVRQRLTAVQLLTIAAGYALYFPLLLYLSANFSFKWALLIAYAVPGILLANYARWLLGGVVGLIGAFAFLLFYQVFPTLAAFAGWNRGMVLLCLGVVTLGVLINLQNSALKRNAALVPLMMALLALPFRALGADVQLMLPAEIVSRLAGHTDDTTNSIVAFDPAQYQVRQEASYFRVDAQIPFQVLRVGETTVPLFDVPVHLQQAQSESGTDFAHLVSITNGLRLFVQRPGAGTLRLSYRAPIVNHEGKKRAQIPLALGTSGNVQLEAVRNDIEILTGNLWSTKPADKATAYDIGVAGLDTLLLEWRGDSGEPSGTTQTNTSGKFYGIGLTRAEHLTVINSDGSCTHFAEFDLPAAGNDEFRMKLPVQARLISVSVNGNEIGLPQVEEGLCRVRLPAREGQQSSHRLSFRVAYPKTLLGFVGTVELTLPEVFQTIGTLDWIVALPSGFEAQVISSGLERRQTPADLSRFGDYGRILQTHPLISFAKDLAPPGIVGLSLRYRQTIPGMYEAKAE